MQPSFHYLVHTCEVDFSAEPPRVTEIICTIAGFNSESYAMELAQKHARASSDYDSCIIVTTTDNEDAIRAMFRRGKLTGNFDTTMPGGGK